MSSRRRRHSGPPSPPYTRALNPADDYYFYPSGYGSASLCGQVYSSQPPPPPTYSSFDSHRRTSLPADHGEPVRGRHPYRQAPSSDLSGRRYSAHVPSTPPHGYGYDDSPRARRPPPSHSQDRRAPPLSRHGRRSRSHAPSRSKSAASSSQRERQPKEDAGDPWWQNPIVRTCAVTALSTGISAALDSRGDPGQWKGAKGAKVAVATVGSALVDGFLGNKHPDGLRHNVMKKGMEVAMDKAEEKKHEGVDEQNEDDKQPRRRHSAGRHHSRRHSPGRRSHGRRH
ncbi:hypothetical protein QQS21_006556 [Conoideocrella luteorostrata]|uniref:Uncharacterized protein n=1 Tax=Conoideocrella luteorostrata TaxID=1105319 RepID=A0AAJ0CMC8_9HYPO|nr:hypothetical protein QQS21_006556 [Conoideocrella luteorostrata]